MIKLRKIFIILSLFFVNVLYSCMPYKSERFNNKNQIIDAVKENIDDLNALVKELDQKFKDVENLTIENKLFKIWNNSKTYYSKTSIEIFKKLKINYISVANYDDDTKDSIKYKFGDDIYMNYKDCRISFNIKNSFGYNCGIYYSLDNDSNYLYSKQSNSDLYISTNIYTAHISIDSLRSGWYTEKICDNWYYYEEDYDNLYFINYIKEDLKQLDIYPKIYNRFKEYFVEDKDFVYSTTSSLPKE